jgi:hypothetical protein
MEWFRKLLKPVWPKHYPYSNAPRMPESQEEAERVYRHWAVRNGRYYFLADVVLDDGILRHDVEFDGDSNIAVRVSQKKVSEQPELIGCLIVEALITSDYSSGHRYTEATDAERQAFTRKHGG